MAISKRSEYALRALFELAYRDSRRPVKIHEIAESQVIPHRFLEAIMSDLKHAGFVESRRGSEGGYVLARNVDELVVGDVLDAVRGHLSVGPDHKGKNGGRGYCTGDKAFDQYWHDLDHMVGKVLQSTSFADLVKHEQVQSRDVLDFCI